MINRRRRRNPILANIWWLLAIIIIGGLAANYFLLNKSGSAKTTVHPEQNHAYLGAETLLNIESWQTSQGLNTYFLPIGNLPIVDIQLIFTAGSAYDGDIPGIAQITNQLVGKNTQTLNTDAITEKFESLGAIYNSHVSRDAATVSLRTLSFNDEKTGAIDLFTEIFKSPLFTEDSFTLEKEQLLTAIAAQNQSPQAQANKAYYQAIYGTHPYGKTPLGSEASVQMITLNQVMDFYQHFYNRNNVILIITGDMNREMAETVAENLGAALMPGAKAPEIPTVTLPAATVIEHVEFPSTQKHILIGIPSLEKGNPDFFAFYIGNEILGGSGLSSKLFEVVREEEGLAYSVRSQIMPLKQKGPFTISLQTRNDSSDIALALVQEHLGLFIKNGPTNEELKKAKQNISGQFLMAFNSNAAIAQHVAALAFYHLPLDYYDHYLDKINAVTVDDIKAAFASYVGSQNLVTVTLGVDEKQ